MAKAKRESKAEGVTKETRLITIIIDAFDELGLDYDSDVVVGSTSSDFFVESPSGSTAVFEAKAWPPTEQNLVRASHLASLYRGTSGADYAFVVMSGDFPSDPNAGVVSTAEIDQVIEENLIKSPKKRRRKRPKVKPKPKNRIFASMPFSGLYDDTYLVAMKPAAIELDIDCIRVDYEQFTGDIVAEIKSLISDSVGVIADLSESRPNVLFELGFAEALKKPCVQICTDRSQLPFNVRNNRTLQYSIGQTSRLKFRLFKEFQAMLKRS